MDTIPEDFDRLKAELHDIIAQHVDAAGANELEARFELVELLGQVVETQHQLSRRIDELEHDLLQARAAVHRQDLILKGDKPRIRVRAGSRRPPNRVWPAGKSKRHAAD
jgi:hypothetical protein